MRLYVLKSELKFKHYLCQQEVERKYLKVAQIIILVLLKNSNIKSHANMLRVVTNQITRLCEPNSPTLKIFFFSEMSIQTKIKIWREQTAILYSLK